MLPHELAPFERGIDFVLHFTDREFTLFDIVDRYQCCYKTAQNIREKVSRVFDFEFVRFQESPAARGAPARNVWRLKRR